MTIDTNNWKEKIVPIKGVLEKPTKETEEKEVRIML